MTQDEAVRERTRLRIALAIGLVAVLAVGSCPRRGGHSGGEVADPSYKAAAQSLVRQRLRDPASAEFSDLRVIPGRSQGSKTVCGRVNARNGFGGMTGPGRFIVGPTVTLEEEIGSAAMDGLWAGTCR
jgi:hypothetical protein